MHLTVTARSRVDREMRTYAVEKLERLGRHDGKIHEARAVLEEDERHVPPASAEVSVHLHHTTLRARCDGTTLREAIDKVIDKIDRQIVRQKEKVKEHKGRAAAGSDPLAPGPRHVAEGAAAAAALATAEPAPADPVASRRRITLQAMSVEAAVGALQRSGAPLLLFLDEDGGELCVLTRRDDGEIELIVGDTR
jgi:putative sigma-54 modulation protein